MCSIQTKEIIDMVLQALLVITGLILLWSLFLQRKSIQANIFNDFSGRTSDLIREIPPASEKPMVIQNWYVRLFNDFERFIFLINNHYVAKKMEEYYRGLIIRYVEKVTEEFPDVACNIDRLQGGLAYVVLKTYYKKNTKEDAFVVKA